MPTFKAEIQNKRKDGTYNVRIRVTHNSKIKRISTNLYVTSDEVTRSMKLKDCNASLLADDLIRKCREACNKMGMEIQSLSIDALVEKLKVTLSKGDTFRLDFIEYAERLIRDMSEGTRCCYNSTFNAIRRYTMRNELDISEINTSFLQGFERFLMTESAQRELRRKGKVTEGKGGQTISLYMTCIRAIHNRAKEEYNDEDRGIINIPFSPFKHYKIRPRPRSRKRAISVELIQKIINLPYRKDTSERWSSYNLAKDCFLLSFILIGMNSVDMYYAKPPVDGVLIYNRQKTASRREDQAEMRVRVERCAECLVDRYKGRETFFNFRQHYSGPVSFNHSINIGLKEIGKEIGVDNLTFYAARHSWATIARSAAVGIDKATVHEALNHVDSEMKITDIYIDRDWSVIWEANKKVLELFNWSELYSMCLG